jgi:poly(ADP-ribose) glycohydrolase ARH3
VTRPDLREVFRGALLGTAVGDALGAPFEGWAHVEATPLEIVGRSDEPLRWTDDTAMTIATAESLVACGGFDGADLAARFVAAYEREPWRGYGAGPPQVLAAIRAGAAWDQPARELFGGAGSFGNGGAMRAAPAGLLGYRDVHGAAHLARQCAAVTHTHELGLQGAALQAAAVAWLVGSQPPDWDAGPALVDGLRRIAPDEEFQRQLDQVVAVRDADSEHAAVHLGNGIAAIEAVPAALWAFLRHPTSFADAVRAAIQMGGDTDTIAAMTGALSGAFLGAAAIPDQWLDRLEARKDITRLADDVCVVATDTRLSAIAPK